MIYEQFNITQSDPYAWYVLLLFTDNKHDKTMCDAHVSPMYFVVFNLYTKYVCEAQMPLTVIISRTDILSITLSLYSFLGV